MVRLLAGRVFLRNGTLSASPCEATCYVMVADDLGATMQFWRKWLCRRSWAGGTQPPHNILTEACGLALDGFRGVAESTALLGSLNWLLFTLCEGPSDPFASPPNQTLSDQDFLLEGQSSAMQVSTSVARLRIAKPSVRCSFPTDVRQPPLGLLLRFALAATLKC